MKTATTERPIAAQFPLRIALALVAARGLTEIDRVTDDAVRQGLVRPRTDCSRLSEWQRMSLLGAAKRTWGDV